jgi:hypothetical protein
MQRGSSEEKRFTSLAKKQKRKNLPMQQGEVGATALQEPAVVKQ